MKSIENKQKTLVKTISVLGLFLPLTIVLNYIIQFLTIPPFGRLDFTHLPTLVLAITYGPWVAGINAFFGDLLGALLRGYAPWLQISFARMAQGIIAGYAIMFWKKRFKKLSIPFIIILFALLFFGIEFIGYASAFKFYTGRGVAASASLYYVPRLLKTPIMLPLWIWVILFFDKRSKK